MFASLVPKEEVWGGKKREEEVAAGERRCLAVDGVVDGRGVGGGDGDGEAAGDDASAVGGGEHRGAQRAEQNVCTRV